MAGLAPGIKILEHRIDRTAKLRPSLITGEIVFECFSSIYILTEARVPSHQSSIYRLLITNLPAYSQTQGTTITFRETCLCQVSSSR